MQSNPWRVIVVEVISHIDPRDTTTLLACSLTHRSWTLVAQRRLYRTLNIRNGEAMRRWHEFDAKNRFIPYIHHLIYCGDKANALRPRDFLGIYGRQFLYFNKLDTLEMRYLELDRFTPNSLRMAFGRLGGTLRALYIRDSTITTNKFLQLLNLLPQLHCLGLSRFAIGRESSRFTGDRPTFRGTLNLSGPVSKRGLKFIVDLTRELPNFSSVRLRLNLSYRITRRLLEIPDIANNVTTMLLGYQDDAPERIDLSLCQNLRTLSILTQDHPGELSTNFNTPEFFRLLSTITSRELEFIVVDTSRGSSPIRYSTWGQFFKVFGVLQASCKRLSVFIGSYGKFMAERFKKGETLVRFLGV